MGDASKEVECEKEAEFVLKVALFTRAHLHIRTTGNYLMALAARHSVARGFLVKYLPACVMLPSDWVQVPQFFWVCCMPCLALRRNG